MVNSENKGQVEAQHHSVSVGKIEFLLQLWSYPTQISSRLNSVPLDSCRKHPRFERRPSGLSATSEIPRWLAVHC